MVHAATSSLPLKSLFHTAPEAVPC